MNATDDRVSSTVNHASFTIERTYPVPPATTFSAFSDEAKKRRWYAKSRDIAVEQFESDFRVGGTERATFRIGDGAPLPAGTLMTNNTVFQDIVPDRRIVLAYTMTVGDHRISASLLTFEFHAAGDGTHLVLTEQAAFFEHADGPEMRKTGQGRLLDQLARELAAQ